MKQNLLVLASLLVAVTSCMKGTTFSTDYSLTDEGDFSNSDELFEDNADVYLFPISNPGETGAFVVNSVIAYFSLGGSSSLYGGFALSRQSWKEPEPEEQPEEGTGEEADGTAGSETETPSVPGAYSVYGSNSSTVNTFYYFRQSATMPEHDMGFAAADIGTCAPNYVLVNNSAATVRAIKGENVEDNVFRLNGNLTLRATGYLDGNKTGESATFLLAGKGMSKLPATEENPQRDSIVTSWSHFDLSKLGSIDYIDFDLEFSDPTDKTIIQTPDVCLDNFTARIHISY